MLAGRIDAEQQTNGIKIPFEDLLIGAEALDLGYSVVTGNIRHFKIIPGLTVFDL
jgi:predicted nucleic acid-binding protein